MRRGFAITVLALVSFARLSAAQDSHALLAEIFRDHAVIQRNQEVPVWGRAAPGETITVRLGSASARTVAGASGDWSVRLPAIPAGGPYTLEARSSGGAAQSASDVLVGDVFLCSGQSNMALQVSRTLDAENEIRAGANERIRMLTIETVSDVVPRASLPGKMVWEVASPETVGNWSATCYYFARELQKTVDVPFGLVNASWGGSDIRAWMSQETLSSIPEYAEPLALLKTYATDEPAAQRGFGQRWEAWWRRATNDQPGAEPWQPRAGAEWPVAPEALGDWKTWGISELQQHNGMLWHRATFTLTADQARQGARLALGGIDEVDQTWINSHVLGNTFGWGSDRTYPVPSGLLREGENVVVVNVLNTWGQGGLIGEASRRALELEGGARIPLSDWRYRLVPLSVGMPPRSPWDAVSGLSTIHNAMVAPLRDYGIRGVVWYQGESNTGDPGSYRALLRGQMAQWRAQFGRDLPVLIVQLPNFGRANSTPVESNWAELREAQRLAVRDDPRAGMVVTIDAGDPEDIHPANKQVVGRRLARAARHFVYGEAITPSGPAPAGATRSGDIITVTFEGAGGGLTSRGPLAGFELCGAGRGTCRTAEGRIDGTRVLLQAPPGEAIVRVRYCWGDNPACTLNDTADLPAGPFELTIQ